ncbi:hypothetical protein C8T65DRAFT_519861, partial [Cerioporus squamosus]
LTLGSVLGGPTITLRKLMGKENKGVDRLCRILVPEAAHFIWKQRCERVITKQDDPGQDLSEAQILGQWRAAAKRRAVMDWSGTNPNFQSKPVSRELVAATWEKVL